MPRISEFFGIEIYMYWRDHHPPHFHAYYGGDEVTISIKDLSVLAGSLPPRARGLVTRAGLYPLGRRVDTEHGTAASERGASARNGTAADSPDHSSSRPAGSDTLGSAALKLV